MIFFSFWTFIFAFWDSKLAREAQYLYLLFTKGNLFSVSQVHRFSIIINSVNSYYSIMKTIVMVDIHQFVL